MRPGRLPLYSVLAAILLRCEIIDRIAVSVGKQVITEAQIEEEVRVTEFLNRDSVDLSAARKREAADRLIEQTLVRRDMEVTHYPQPKAPEADDLERQIRAAFPASVDFDAELRRYGLTMAELRQHLLWQRTLLTFIDYRFRPAIQVSDAEIAQYYEEKKSEWARDDVAKIPTLDESRADIEKILTQKRIDQALDSWLSDVRTRADIVYRPEAFH